jgi:hypothetical protein
MRYISKNDVYLQYHDTPHHVFAEGCGLGERYWEEVNQCCPSERRRILRNRIPIRPNGLQLSGLQSAPGDDGQELTNFKQADLGCPSTQGSAKRRQINVVLFPLSGCYLLLSLFLSNWHIYFLLSSWVSILGPDAFEFTPAETK